MTIKSRTLGVVLVVGLGLGIGCATQRPPADEAASFEPRGPGSVFATVEAAAIDALAYAHLQRKASGEPFKMAGGTIRATAEGFTYDVVQMAVGRHANVIELRLRRDDVARFHAYPRTGVMATAARTSGSRARIDTPWTRSIRCTGRSSC